MTTEAAWTVWNGKSSRPPTKDLVFVEFRDGTMHSDPLRPQSLNWWHINNSPSDIVAYRLARGA